MSSRPPESGVLRSRRQRLLQSIIRPVGHKSKGLMGLNKFLHNESLTTTLDILLAVDVLILIATISLEVQFLKSEIDDFEHACLSGQCSMFANEEEAEEEFDEFGDQDLKKAEEILLYISVGILSLFALELSLLFIANPKEFLSSPFHCLDLVVVVVALVFETAFQDLESVGFLVVARTWRFVRIGHAIVEVEEHVHEHKKHAETENVVAGNATVETEEAVVEGQQEAKEV
uniref:Voltage-gated hydrogen channel 1 n=1 Tax=Pinguiococcus pyrenoidosus TaxID=172671 RepID=A0A7R9UEE5_9STRA|mmetsp:Transcript_7739/g.29054  ORF Transcript_7739/g.29054 Transcript_7739/m.29054 type:complete len:231 (+) Transcript_7739:121-813(+)